MKILFQLSQICYISLFALLLWVLIFRVVVDIIIRVWLIFSKVLIVFKQVG